MKRFLHIWSEVKKDKQWLEQEKYPTQAEKNKMIDVVVVIGIKFVMENHIHTFVGELFYQLDGGPIGDKLTTEIHDCLMLDWDNRVISKLEV